MKKLIVFLFCLLSFTYAKAQVFSQEINHFGSNPGNLVMYLHQPNGPADTFKTGDKKPLVIVLHGCNQDAKSIAQQSGWNKLADHFDFYVLYPEQKRINNPSNCFNWFREKDTGRNSGEMASIKQMVDHVRAHYTIDTTRIFVYGLSAGAAMTSIIMANYPGTINSGAVLAGGPYKMASGAMDGLLAMAKPKIKSSATWGKLVKENNPGYAGRYPHLVVCHGKNDKVVNPKNSEELIKQWAYVLGTDTVPAQTLKAFAGAPDVEKKIYTDKKGEERIYFYEVDHLGHALLVDPGEPITKGGETGLFSVDKDFFSTYWIAKDFGLVK